jgi:hypothetical protein
MMTFYAFRFPNITSPRADIGGTDTTIWSPTSQFSTASRYVDAEAWQLREFKLPFNEF